MRSSHAVLAAALLSACGAATAQFANAPGLVVLGYPTGVTANPGGARPTHPIMRVNTPRSCRGRRGRLLGAPDELFKPRRTTRRLGASRLPLHCAVQASASPRDAAGGLVRRTARLSQPAPGAGRFEDESRRPTARTRAQRPAPASGEPPYTIVTSVNAALQTTSYVLTRAATTAQLMAASSGQVRPSGRPAERCPADLVARGEGGGRQHRAAAPAHD